MVLGDLAPKPKVAYLGPIASYSHQVRGRKVNKVPAALSYYDCIDRPVWARGLTDRVFAQATMGSFSASDFEYVPCAYIKDIFDAVQSDSCAHGIIPFENSTNGPVMFTLDLLADRESAYPDITVYDETYVDVHHYLVGNLPPSHDSTPSMQFESGIESRAHDSGTCTPTMRDPHPQQPRTKPLTSLSHITRLYSHPQAFGQCELFLQTYMKGVERIDVSSTSRAAEVAKEDGTGRSAAISSKAASEIHKINVLARGIEDKTDNCTRFLIIRKTEPAHREYSSAIRKEVNGANGAKEDTGSWSAELVGGGTATKTLVSFTVGYRSPGALADVLECLRRHGLNLTSINSRPSNLVPFQYIFFVELMGSRIEDSGGQVEKALAEIAQVATGWRWLGSWKDRFTKLGDL